MKKIQMCLIENNKSKTPQMCLSYFEFPLFPPPPFVSRLLLHYSTPLIDCEPAVVVHAFFAPFFFYCFDTNQSPKSTGEQRRSAQLLKLASPRVAALLCQRTSSAKCALRWADVAAPSPLHFYANQCKVTWTAIIYMFPQGLSPPKLPAHYSSACAYNLCCIIFCFIS